MSRNTLCSYYGIAKEAFQNAREFEEHFQEHLAAQENGIIVNIAAKHLKLSTNQVNTQDICTKDIKPVKYVHKILLLTVTSSDT